MTDYDLSPAPYVDDFRDRAAAEGVTLPVRLDDIRHALGADAVIWASGYRLIASYADGHSEMMPLADAQHRAQADPSPG